MVIFSSKACRLVTYSTQEAKTLYRSNDKIREFSKTQCALFFFQHGLNLIPSLIVEVAGTLPYYKRYSVLVFLSVSLSLLKNLHLASSAFIISSNWI